MATWWDVLGGLLLRAGVDALWSGSVALDVLWCGCG